MLSSGSIVVALLTLALSAQAIPHHQQGHPQEQCAAASTSTVFQTVTVTAGAGKATAATTDKAVNNGGSAKTTTSVKAAATTSTKNSGSNNGGGKNTAKATSTKASAATTDRAVVTSAVDNTGGGKNTAKGTSTSSSSAAATSAASAGGGKNDSGAQSSLTLDPGVISSGFANDGQDVPTAGQVPSLTSTNNFINFCLTVPGMPLTNGKQITTGSCNTAPIGVIPSVDNMPSSKFTFPPNFGTIKANTTFTIEMAIQNMETGHFVNAQENYFSAPQQLNAQGQIQGHSHVVIEPLTSIDQTTATDPKKFAFFKGLNAAAVGGKLTADVTAGLSPGFYKLSSINSAANHQPVIVPIAQHGSLDDAIYFTVTLDGNPADNTAAKGGKGGATATTSAVASAVSSAAASASVSVSEAATASVSASSVAISSASASAVASETKGSKGGKGGKDTASTSAAAVATPSAIVKGAPSAIVKEAPSASASASASSSVALPSETAKSSKGKRFARSMPNRL